MCCQTATYCTSALTYSAAKALCKFGFASVRLRASGLFQIRSYWLKFWQQDALSPSFRSPICLQLSAVYVLCPTHLCRRRRYTAESFCVGSQLLAKTVALAPPTICWQRTLRLLQMYRYKFRRLSRHHTLVSVLQVFYTPINRKPRSG